MSEHFCEYDAGLREKGFNVEPCGATATVKWRGRWYCEDHADTMEAGAELAEALANVSGEEAAQSTAQLDADLEEQC